MILSFNTNDWLERSKYLLSIDNYTSNHANQSMPFKILNEFLTNLNELIRLTQNTRYNPTIISLISYCSMMRFENCKCMNRQQVGYL